MTQRSAEALRLEATRLALEYADLAERHHLDPQVIRDDAAAVIAAWSALVSLAPPT
jgi:hypothetical protein